MLNLWGEMVIGAGRPVLLAFVAWGVNRLANRHHWDEGPQ